MCKKNLIAASKSLSKNKLGTFLNIMGLSIGITCVLVAILFVQHELSIDRFHQKIDNIYRLLIVGERRDDSHALEYHSDIIQSRVRFLRKLPEIKRVIRLVPERGKIKHMDTWIRENRFWFTDPNIFNMLTLPLRYGDSKTVLQAPNSVVITPAMATKYFGNNNPIGKTFIIQFSIIPVQYTFKVTGILEPLPNTSSIQIDFLAHIPFEKLTKDRREMSGNMSEWVYVMTLLELDHPSSYASLKAKLSKIICHDAYKHMRLSSMAYRLEPLKGAHLKSKASFTAPSYNDFTERKGNVQLLIMFSVLSLIALVVSCVNTMNFSAELTTQTSKKVETHHRESATRKRLLSQFLVKNALMICGAIIWSLVLLESILPVFNSLFEREISVNYSTNWIFWLGVLATDLLAVLLSSFFPTLMLSSLKVDDASGSYSAQSYPFLRKGIIISQIGLGVVVLILSQTIWDELNAIKAKDIGFDARNLIFFQLDDENLVEYYPAFKEELLHMPGVRQVTASNYVPWAQGAMLQFAYYDDDAVVIADTIFADSSFLETYQIPVVDGEGFSTKWSEMPGYVIINETARRILQSTGTDPLSNAVGIPMVGGLPVGEVFWQNRVQGIIQDFFTIYPSKSIQPLSILPSYHSRYLKNYITIRLLNQDHAKLLSQIEEVVKRFYPQSLFDVKYVANEMEKMHHQRMDRYLNAIFLAAGFAICITLIGFLSYATYETNRCTTENAIRKAFGAKSIQIVNHFIIRFVKLVLAANVIAWPISYLFLEWSLKVFDYPYSIQISITHVLLVGLLSILFAIIVVLPHVYHAAIVDPVKALRHEPQPPFQVGNAPTSI